MGRAGATIPVYSGCTGARRRADMWKLVGGILAAIVILVIGVAYWGWQKLKSFANDNGPVTVVIGAAPDRVFRVLADADSIDRWMSEGRIRRLHPGLLKPGDT